MEPITLLDRYRGAMVGLAAGDALGTAVEFQAPGTFEPLTDMIGGGPFNLAPGEWTDDTSMALCLAESLIEIGRFDPADQAERYVRWWRTGHLSSHGQCFDIGNTVRYALERFEITGAAFSGPTSVDTAGNGSLMRLAPVPLFFAQYPAEAVARAAESSMTTHGAREAVDACRLMAALIVGALQGKRKEELTAAGFFGSFVQTIDSLSPRIAEIAAGSFASKKAEEIRGSGYVVESLEAALWAFARSSSFREGALLAVNLGDDADTTGAVFGQLAGAYYGLSGIPAEWRDRVAKRDLIEDFATKLFDRALAPLGTRRHVLELTSAGSLYRLNNLLTAVGAQLANGGPVRPLGYRQPSEYSLPDFVTLCKLNEHFTKTIGAWQVTERAKSPTWHLLGMLDLGGRPGLLMVEAATHASEKNGSAEHVVAAPYLVASCGLDAVLLFLGFTGDDFFPDAFRDAEAFATKIRTRLADLVPPDVIGRRVPHRSGGSMSILVGTLPVGSPSGRL